MDSLSPEQPPTSSDQSSLHDDSLLGGVAYSIWWWGVVIACVLTAIGLLLHDYVGYTAIFVAIAAAAAANLLRSTAE